MNVRTVVAPALVGLCALLGADAAAARSCIGHAYERMNLERLRVRIDGVEVEPPDGMVELEEALNSGNRGRWLLLNGPDFRQFVALVEATPPSPTQDVFMASISKSGVKTSCGYYVNYTPIIPGRYVHPGDDSREPRVLPLEAEILVAADRQTLGLRYPEGEHIHEIEYRVTCAHFDWNEQHGPCGPIEEASPLFTGIPEKFARPPARIEPIAAVEPAPIAPGRGCAIGARAGGGLSMLALILLARRRRREPAPPHEPAA